MVAIKLTVGTVLVAMLGASNALIIPTSQVCAPPVTVTQYVTRGASELQGAASSAAQQFSEYQGAFSSALGKIPGLSAPGVPAAPTNGGASSSTSTKNGNAMSTPTLPSASNPASAFQAAASDVIASLSKAAASASGLPNANQYSASAAAIQSSLSSLANQFKNGATVPSSVPVSTRKHRRILTSSLCTDTDTTAYVLTL